MFQKKIDDFLIKNKKSDTNNQTFEKTIKNRMSWDKTPKELILKMRAEVRKGKTKIQVAGELGVSYSTVKKYTPDIHIEKRIPAELIHKLRDEIKNGKLVNDVAKELKVSRDTVIKYSKDIPKKNKKTKRSPELIKQIRDNVRKYNSKKETAKKMGLTYKTICYYSQDIKTGRISQEEKEIIRERVRNGEKKLHVAKDMNISKNKVSELTRDISFIQKKADISYKPFKLLQELLKKGYAFSGSQYGCKDYQKLRKEIPSVCRVRIRGKQIFFLEEKSDIAARAFLGSLKKRISDYHELKRVIKVFKTCMGKEEKNKYIRRKKSKKQFNSKKIEVARLRENGDSFVKIKLFHLFSMSRS